jgi:hypothetical protein
VRVRVPPVSLISIATGAVLNEAVQALGRLNAQLPPVRAKGPDSWL